MLTRVLLVKVHKHFCSHLGFKVKMEVGKLLCCFLWHTIYDQSTCIVCYSSLLFPVIGLLPVVLCDQLLCRVVIPAVHACITTNMLI